ncbi:MAG: 3'-5' exonuclease [Deltaproteobacteria bacterium]|nr:3'-5' exonuclease [Deltaproteobacteria bacterium]
MIFDCETTGIDFAQDQIIEICVQQGLDGPDGGDAAARTWRIRPSVAIQPGAQAVHGISKGDLEGCPSFPEVAQEIAAVFATADIIVGYNVAFDIAMLQAEYSRLAETHPAGRALDLAGKQIVDALRLWQKCEPRSLQHAHQRFVGDQFAAAHSARADVAATGRVLAGMLKHFGLDEPRVDWDRIATVSDPNRSK